MKLKLAIIGCRGYPANFPGSSGIDTYIEKLIPNLIPEINISLFTRSWSKTNINIKNITIYKIPCFAEPYFDTSIYSFLATIKALLTQHNIFWYHAPSSTILAPLARLFGKNVIITFHGVDWKRKKWNNPITKLALKLLEYIAIKSANICTAVSQDLVDYYTATYHKNFVLTPPGFTPKIKIKPNIIYKNYFLKQNKYILYFGRFVPEKRVEWLITAFQSLPKINQKYKLVIAGHIENNKYSQSLLNIANNKNIIFTNYVSGKLKEELLSNCLLFVLPSNLEGNSLSLIEALEYNKNCLASDIPIHQQIKNTYPNITLFKNDSFRDFASKLSATKTKDVNSLNNFSTKQIKWSELADFYIQLFNNENIISR